MPSTGGSILASGEALDADGQQDGVITLDLARLEPIAEAPTPPETLAAGDVVVLIDAETLGLSQTTVSGPASEPDP